MPYQIEAREFAFTASPFYKLLPTPHIHAHLELIYLKKGTSVAVLDNRKYLLEAGEMFVSFPNQIHFYHDRGSVEGYMIIFTPELFRELREVFQTKIPDSPILHRKQLPPDMISRMDKICEKLRTGSVYDEISARGCLLTLLGEVLPFMTLSENPGDQDTIKNVLKYCMENYTEPLSLELLAKELHLNKYYISHIFRERMNISYKDFINHLRVEHACNLLEQGTSITNIAYTCGFASVRTFNRAFLKHLEMTPREYVRMRMQDREKDRERYTWASCESCCD